MLKQWQLLVPAAFGQSPGSPTGHWPAENRGSPPCLDSQVQSLRLRERRRGRQGGLLPPPHPAASSSLGVPVRSVWGFGTPGSLRSESVSPACGLHTFLVAASPLLPPRPAPPHPRGLRTHGNQEERPSSPSLSPSESAHHTAEVTQRRRSSTPHPPIPGEGLRPAPPFPGPALPGLCLSDTLGR